MSSSQTNTYDYRAELYMGSDNGPFWVSVAAPDGTSRSRGQALDAVEGFMGRFEDPVVIFEVDGVVENEGTAESTFRVCDDDAQPFWQVDV